MGLVLRHDSVRRAGAFGRAGKKKPLHGGSGFPVEPASRQRTPL
ncbi:hypothetical protein L810_3746 [Burkholderia sp. AU4i]|nr:hypothetical protein L810_3746 [Burkholderia sp. AU4i]MDW9226727.1 hypothetical protein [Burkholderia cepacia]MDW9242212.1 hypothetical protein [Burkholderia cepacia]